MEKRLSVKYISTKMFANDSYGTSFTVRWFAVAEADYFNKKLNLSPSQIISHPPHEEITALTGSNKTFILHQSKV